MLRYLANYLQLGRIWMAPLTMSVPVMGALTDGYPLSTSLFWSLALLGLCAHNFGFALNDIIDLPLDRTVPLRQKSPLVKGRLKLWQAWVFVIAQVVVGLYLLFFVLKAPLIVVVVIGLSFILSIIYNGWSKWGHLPRFIAELCLANSVGLLCLAGALLKTPHLSWQASLFALTLSLLLLLLNSVNSGLKDLKNDSEFGANSFVIATGCRIIDEEQVYISQTIRAYTFSVQALIGGGLLGLLRVYQLEWYLILVVVLFFIFATGHLRVFLAAKTFTTLRRSLPLLSGYYNYFALSLFIIKAMPFYVQVCYGVVIGLLFLFPWGVATYLWLKI